MGPRGIVDVVFIDPSVAVRAVEKIRSGQAQEYPMILVSIPQFSA